MKILLTGAFGYTQEQINEIQQLGFETDFIQDETDEIDYAEYVGIVCNGLFLHHDIEKFKNLKFIQLTSAGYDRVPMEYVKKNGIRVYNAAGVYSIPIAEHTVLKILEFYKKSRAFYKKQDSHNWDKERNISELYGKRIAIIGCGNIGMEIAKRLKGFDAEITGVDINEVYSEYIDRFEKSVNLNNVLRYSDIVVLTLPLNDKTKGFIGRECFENMKNQSFLVNVSRGQIVDQEALIDALKSGKLAGAALDVFEEEPLSQDSELWDMDNVIITPHNSFVGEHNAVRMFRVIYANLKNSKREIEK